MNENQMFNIAFVDIDDIIHNVLYNNVGILK